MLVLNVMKKAYLYTIVVFVFFTQILFSQPDVDTRLKTLEDKFEALNKSIEEETNVKSKSNSEIVQFREANIKKSIDFLSKLNSDISFQNEIQGTALYLSYIVKINNASNDLLGFSLKDKITEFLIPITNELKEDRGSFLGGIVEKILEIPIVGNVVKAAGTIIESPVFKTISSVLPITSTLSSVSSLVSAVIFSEDKNDLNITVVDTFQRNISSIFGIYNKLDNLNSNFNNEQIELQIRTQSLNNKVNSKLLEIAKRLYADETVVNDTDSYTLLSRYFNGTKLNDQVTKIKDNRNANRLINEKRLYYPPEGKITLEEMYQDYFKITLEYRNSYENLHNGLLDLLSNDSTLNNMLNDEQRQKRNLTIEELKSIYIPLEQGQFFNNELRSLKDELDAVKKYYEM